MFRPTSDLDLVMFGDNIDRHRFDLLKEALVESDLPFAVDIHCWSLIPESFHQQIKTNYIALYSPTQPPNSAHDSPGKTVLALSEICSLITVGATPKHSRNMFQKQGNIAFIRSHNINKTGLNYENMAFIAPEYVADSHVISLQSDDVLMVLAGAHTGTTCLVTHADLPATPHNHVALLRPNPQKVLPHFLLSVLNSNTHQARIQTISRALPHTSYSDQALSPDILTSWELALPLVSEQEALIAKTEYGRD